VTIDCRGERKEKITYFKLQTGTERDTDGRDHYTFRLGYASREM